MKRKSDSLLEEICRVLTDSGTPQQSLQTIVELVAREFDINVSSVYLLDDTRTDLVLRATVGLNPQAIDTIRMTIKEGLTGLTLQQGSPLLVRNPAAHPRFKYFKGSGEDAMHTFLGLPLIFHKQSLGVLTIQTKDADAIDERDIPVFAAIASQIAATVAYSGLLKDLEKERRQHRNLAARINREQPVRTGRRTRKKLIRGLPVSAGFAIGNAHYVLGGIGFDQIHDDTADNPAHEKTRLEKAFKAADGQIRQLLHQATNLPDQDAAIIEAHLMLLGDKTFREKIFTQVEKGLCAESALKKTVQRYLERFLNLDDPYLRERASDIEDLGKRVLRNLLGIQGHSEKTFDRDTIIVAADISAVDVVSLKQPHLKGIVLARGGKTAHAVILAKSFEIPMIIGLKEILEAVREGDHLIVDGNTGVVFRNPPQVIIDEYRRLKAEKAKRHQQLGGLRDAPALTKDGFKVDLGANVGLLSDMDLVDKYGADHVGLYRTEFPFLVRRSFPSEDEQVALYRKIIGRAAGRVLTLRTLDVGGDKFLAYLDSPKELNPYLGWRSIRVSLELDAVFRTQIRAVLRASCDGPVRLMFPMISSTAEVKQIRAIVAEEKARLKTQNIAFGEHLPLGIMVEVPGAVKILPALLRLVDFISIGTNDLIQYILAVDRNNEKVAPLYNPLHPAVIATIAEIATACQKAQKPFSICGEAASNPQCAYLFVAMGTRQLSMNPASIPLIKDFIRSIARSDAQQILALVRTMDDPDLISTLLEKNCLQKGTNCEPPRNIQRS